MFTRIPPIFFRSPASGPRVAYKSFGHLSRVQLPRSPRTFSSRHASTTAKAYRYCMKTSLLAGSEDSDMRNSVENERLPEGESQTLLPRPLPASWCDATETRGVGRRDSKRAFLLKKTVSEGKKDVR